MIVPATSSRSPRFPGDKKVVLGLITSKKPELEDPEVIKARIAEAAQYVPLDRLCLSTQCGFASTEEGNKLTEEAAVGQDRARSVRRQGRMGRVMLAHA